MKKTTVFLSDDHAAFRAGLRLLLKAADDIEVIGEAENGHRAMGETTGLKRDEVLLDTGAGRLFEQPRNGNAESTTSAASVLSDRQTEVVKLIAQGNSTREIARLLSRSVKTI